MCNVTVFRSFREIKGVMTRYFPHTNNERTKPCLGAESDTRPTSALQTEQHTSGWDHKSCVIATRV